MKKTLPAFIAILTMLPFFAKSQWTTLGNDAFFTPSGRLNIGATSATGKFNVFQSTPIGATPKSSSLLTSVAGAAGTNIIQQNTWLVRNSTGLDWYTTRIHDGISIDTYFGSPQVNTQTWWERDPNNNIQSWGSSANTYLTINQGKVGIGTTTPVEKLHVFNNASSGTNIMLSANYNNGYSWRFNTIDRGVAIDLDVTASNNNDVQESILKLSPSFSGRPTFALMNDWLVGRNGNVGIGTETPDSKLAVKGIIHAQAVKVDMNGWADYVFKSTYHLPDLAVVKAYIDQNQRLPEMPSENDVVTNGINLGEMVKLQTKKIEELTLYLIAKDNTEQKQSKIIKQQQEQINSLSAATSQILKELAALKSVVK